MSTLTRYSLVLGVLLLAGCGATPAPAPVAETVEPELLPQPDPRVARYSNGVVWIGPSIAPQLVSVAEAKPAAPTPIAKSAEPVIAKETKPAIVAVAEIKSSTPKPAISVPARPAEKARAAEPAKVAAVEAKADPHVATVDAHAKTNSHAPADAAATHTATDPHAPVKVADAQAAADPHATAKAVDAPALSDPHATAKAAVDAPAPADPHATAKAAADAHADPHAAPTGRTPAETLALLTAGNARFVAGHLEHPDQTVERRSEVAKGQHPYAIVLSCADSRVPPELIFDAGLGDLFVVRVAGNTADDAAIGSIEYAVEHLGANLVIVLGHERCGAVKAAVETADAKTPAPGHLPAVLAPIAPAVEEAKHAHGDAHGDIVDLAVRANVARTVAQLKASDPVLADRVKHDKLQIVGGRYDLDTGAVEIK